MEFFEVAEKVIAIILGLLAIYDRLKRKKK